MTKFICKVCGACCKGEGSVFLYPDDVKRLAENLSMTLQEFINKHTDYVMLETIEKSGAYSYLPYLILKKEKDACVFLETNLCSINKFKPFQCSATPFVGEFFSDEEWRNELKKSCPALKEMKDEDCNEYVESAKISEKMEQSYYLLMKENGFNLETILGVLLDKPKIMTYEE
jgi:uncharacterized protein